MAFSYWGMPDHGYDPRAELEWGYGSILDSRDVNEHCFNIIFTNVNAAFAFGKPMRLEAGELVDLIARKLTPYAKDRPDVLDFGDANMYSEGVAQLVRWHRHYTRFYKQSALYCDLKWPDFYNTNTPDLEGATASSDAGEQVFWNAVTGDTMTFDDGHGAGPADLEPRQRHLDAAGPPPRHGPLRALHLPDAVHQGRAVPLLHVAVPERRRASGSTPTSWGGRSTRRSSTSGRPSTTASKAGTPKTGWPTRKTLAGMDMSAVADELAAAGRLGADA